jgi:methylated-DNA-[protein]-cysteine S-methyltransferase
MLQYSTVDTPAGPFTWVVSAAGAVRASGFTADVGSLLGLIHPSLCDNAGPGAEQVAKPVAEQVADAGGLTATVRSYLAGDLTVLDGVRVEQRTGGAFMTHAWQVMRDIKPGSPLTYSEYAELAGRPAAVRAAAAACAQNPTALFTPCHRVLRRDGSLGGYRWGLPVKTWLLAHEQGRSISA